MFYCVFALSNDYRNDGVMFMGFLLLTIRSTGAEALCVGAP